MQYYRRSAFSQPDDGPQPGKVTERHSGQVDMETSAVPGNTAQRLYQGGIGFLVNVATQDERVMDLAVIGDLDVAGQRNHQPLPVLGHRWRRRWLAGLRHGRAAAGPMSGTGASGFPSGIPVIAIPYQQWPSGTTRFGSPAETCQFKHEKNLVWIVS